MSNIDIYMLKHPEGVIETIELENSFGGAPFVWDVMAQKYLGTTKFQYLFHTDKIWPLWKRKDIPEHHRTVLGITYDNMVITKNDFKRASQDIHKFLEDFPPQLDTENHWLEISEILLNEENADAIGFNWTSVNDSPFMEWDYAIEEYKPLNWKKYWSIYHRFDNQINK